MIGIKRLGFIIIIVGVTICSIAILTPAAFFENVVWDHEIINWIWGYFYERINVSIIQGFYSDPLQLVPSIIFTILIGVCLVTLSVLLTIKRKRLKDGMISLPQYVILALVIAICTIFWMIIMEIAEQQIYGITMWGRYRPSFGIIGMFVGTGLILGGSLLLKYVNSDC